MKSSIAQLAAVCLVLLGINVNAFAQRVRLPASPAAAIDGGTTFTNSPPANNGALSPVPQISNGTTTFTPNTTLGAPTFDPYATQPGSSFNARPTAYPPATQSYGAPSLPPTSGGFGATAPPVYTQPSPSPAFPSSPPVLFPDGNNLWGPGAAGRSNSWAPPLRLIYGPRFRETWLYGDSAADDMQWHDMDFSVAVALPNFLYSGQPIFILPSFGLNLWSGPDGPNVQAPPPAMMGDMVKKYDLPANSYEAFIDVGWQTDPNRILSVDLGGRAGIFTDFDTLTSDSWRFLGKALLRYRYSPRLMVKGGAIYADRNKTKLLPAGGILWQPSEYSRIDLYFPEPKASFYLTTLGNQEVWWYIGGEYGGGSWTIKRASGEVDSIDINDIRLTGGIEWGPHSILQQVCRIGFVEVGWVNSRELRYYKTAAPTPDSVKLKDTIMLRAGIGY